MEPGSVGPGDAGTPQVVELEGVESNSTASTQIWGLLGFKIGVASGGTVIVVILGVVVCCCCGCNWSKRKKVPISNMPTTLYQPLHPRQRYAEVARERGRGGRERREGEGREGREGR
jgi:hypothetical protein